MLKSSKGLSAFRVFALFIGEILLTIVLFVALAVVLKVEGDSSALVILAIVISVQISFITAYVIWKLHK